MHFGMELIQYIMAVQWNANQKVLSILPKITEMGSRAGAEVRGPGSNPGPGVISGLSLLLVLVFSRFSGVPPSTKINISKFQFDWELEDHGFVSRRLLCDTLVKESLFNVGWNLNKEVRFSFFQPEYSGSPLEVVHSFGQNFPAKIRCSIFDKPVICPN